jgi:SHS2 domain-containing protein
MPPSTGDRPGDAIGIARAGPAVGYVPAVRHALPQPYEDLAHTADVGVRVRGATAEEALARLALALGTLLAGLPPDADDGARVRPEREERVAVAGGPGLAGTAVALLRELLFRFATERLIPAEVEVHRAGEDGAEATVGFARYDPDRHGEGVDVKAVTWHAARLEPEGAGWVAQAVLDI